MNKSKLFVAIICAYVAGTSCVVSAEPPNPRKPFYGDWGFDLTARDSAIKPGDNFFAFTNGSWVAKTEIPADRSSISLASMAGSRTEEQLHDLLSTAAAKVSHQPQTIEGKVGAYFKAFMNESRVDALGAAPIKDAIDSVRAAHTRVALASMMGRAFSDFEGTLYTISTDVDLRNQSRYAVYIGQSGLGLPDRDYYLSAEFATQKAQYQMYVERLLSLVGWPDAHAHAKDIIDLETAIAKVSWTKAQDRDPNATYNPMSVSELEALAPAFEWRAFLRNAGLGHVDRVIVAEKSAFPQIAAVFASTPIETLQAWQAFQIADNAAPYLSTPFADVYFEMRKKTLNGQQQQAARWKRAIHAVGGGDCLYTGERNDCFGNLGWAVGQLYTARYFPPEVKANILGLAQNVKSAYRRHIESLEWMSEPTKAEAIRKLEAFTVKVGYPDHPRDYSRVTIRDDDVIGNARRAAADNWRFVVRRLHQAVDRSEWTMTPQTVDAYEGNLLDIGFPAAFLQPPNFDPHADAAVNYGSIGVAIGHELTHALDDGGRKLDSTGVLRDWWTSDDATAFEARAARLGKQYFAFEPIPGVHINGELTVGENIANLGGVTLALEAYRASLHGQPAPVLDGFTGDQRVFLGFAQDFRGKSREEAIRRRIASDPHAPWEFVVNGVTRNIDAWYEAFHVEPGDKLYLAPEERIHIW
jgi:putative endopeptidase